MFELKTKAIFAKCALFFSLACATALPGVKQSIADQNGEYVFYRDASFKRESFIGFLYYDDSTYAARYFAPASQGLAAKNIEILFSVNAEKPHLELTGERFVTKPEADDTQIINYIHDLLYELSARRKKLSSLPFTNYAKNAADFLSAGTRVYDDFPQFGGKVTMVYDPAMPIFNLKKITDYKGDAAFYAVTTGRLASSSDKSFSSFGMRSVSKKNSKNSDQIKQGKKTQISQMVRLNETQNFTQKIQADQNWKKQNESMWTLGDEALVFFSAMKFPEEIANQGKEFLEAQILRRHIQSTEDALCDFENVSIFCAGEKIKLSVKKTEVRSDRVFYDIKIFGRAAANFYGVFSLTAFEDGYKKNRAYYDKIVKSYAFQIE